MLACRQVRDRVLEAQAQSAAQTALRYRQRLLQEAARAATPEQRSAMPLAQGRGSGTVSPRSTARTPVNPRRSTSARKAPRGLVNTP